MKERGKAIYLAFVAALSGLCNALLGAGGGILLTLALRGACGEEMPDRRDLLVNSQASMIAGCALSCLIYFWRDGRAPERFSVFALPALLGGALGGVLLSRIRSKWIGRIFAALVIFSGLRMLFK